MTARLAFVAGGVALAGAVAYRFVRRPRTPPLLPAPASTPDPRAEELRQKLAESRDVVAEREEFEAAETPIDAADPGEDIEERRRTLHERGRTVIDEMK